MQKGRTEPSPAPLIRLLLAVYALLIVYASLYPFTGWRDPGASPFAYLIAPWPRWTSGLDAFLNVLGYAPCGLLCAALLRVRVGRSAALGGALLGAALLSIVLEAAQSYLPARVASNLDVLCNLAGAALGAAAGLRFSGWLLAHGPLYRLRSAAFLPGRGADFGLVLLGLWLFVQLDPTTLLFGVGDLREFVVPLDGELRSPQFFVAVEAFSAAANLTAVGLLLSALLAPRWPARPTLIFLVALALVIRSAAEVLLTRSDPLAWLTPGAIDGLAAGLVAALAAVALPRTVGLGLAAVLIMAATVLVNASPPNPYFAATLALWHQGHFLNFNGVTRLVSAAWPFLALAYLVFLASSRARGAQD
jgi:VanZ family protein